MRLLLSNIDYEIVLSQKPTLLIVENTRVFSEIVGSLIEQLKGDSGYLYLTDKEKQIRIDKKVEFITNPFYVNCNDRKILNKIHQETIAWALENAIETISKVNANIVTLLERLCMAQPYALTYDLELDLGGLLKLYNLKIDEECTDRLDYLISYIKLLHQVNGTNLFVFLNLKQYFDCEQLEYLYEAIFYEQVYLLDIEGYDLKQHSSSEKCIIIDRDLCTIEIN